MKSREEVNDLGIRSDGAEKQATMAMRRLTLHAQQGAGLPARKVQHLS